MNPLRVVDLVTKWACSIIPCGPGELSWLRRLASDHSQRSGGNPGNHHYHYHYHYHDHHLVWPQGTAARLKVVWTGVTRIRKAEMIRMRPSEEGGVMVFFTGAPANIP